MSKNRIEVIIAMYPNCHGIGYVIYESLDEIIDFGIKPVERKSIDNFVDKADWLLDFCKPTVIILLDMIDDNRKSKRIQKGIQNIINMVHQKGLVYHTYTSWHIEKTFTDFGIKTKYERSKLLASWFTMLRGRIPIKRKTGDPEDYQMTLFDAFALMVTHIDHQKLKA
jgi:hypothetical protein